MGLLTGLSLALAVVAQEAPAPEPTPGTLVADTVEVTAGRPAGRTLVTGDSTLFPATLVAARVRDVLRSEADSAAWSQLLAVIDTAPEFADRREADRTTGPLESHTAVADDPDNATADAVQDATIVPDRTGRASGLIAAIRSFPSDLRADLRTLGLGDTGLRVILWIALSLLAVLTVPRLLTARTAPSTGQRPRLGPVAKRIGAARSLAVRGRPDADIAREARVAREALSLLMRAEGRS